YTGAAAKTAAVRLATELRDAGTAAIVAPERSLKAQMRYASSIGAPTVLILGEAELAKGVVTVRDMATAEQREVRRADVGTALAGP
ncbi:MAG: histidine--tRNA ligase, partial [Chloroflexi bacterium]|nr:histidine--tRNA ligase [Chloroflexota bacterium]